MDQKFFKTPFASNGDRQAVPDDMTADGYVSYAEGYGQDYERPLESDPFAKPVERQTMNDIFNDITEALKQYQTASFPEWITPADNGGVSYAYRRGTIVKYRAGASEAFKCYISLTDDNTAAPGTDITKWQPFIYQAASQAEADAGTETERIITPPVLRQSLKDSIDDLQTFLAPFILPVGGLIYWPSDTPPAGWLECNGQDFDTDKYPKLAEVLPSGRVPDFRGLFVRGWAHGVTTDPDSTREILSIQEDAIVNHAHYAGIESYYRYDIPATATRNSPGGESIRQYAARTGSISPAPAVNVAAETRPKNIAVMVIIKTDQADEADQETTPTAIVVTPASTTIAAGKTQQFNASVLPADLAPDYPVTWAVSDEALGTIDSSGLYSSKAGASGEQTIIASISTGLLQLATVAQQIYLESIQLATIPALTVGDDYEVGFTATPSTYTEALLYSSSDSNVVAFSNGTLYTNSAGTATVTITGLHSGVTVSAQVTVNPVVVVEKYLQIENNLNDLNDVAQARDNIGLGELATKDNLSAVDVKAVPLADDAIPAGDDLNDYTTPGQYYQNITSNATTELNYPVTTAGVLVVYKTGVDNGGCRQVYMPYNSTAEFRRYAYGDPLEFGEWDER